MAEASTGIDVRSNDTAENKTGHPTEALRKQAVSSRWFDFLGRKAQHSSPPLDKEVFCDSLLSSADPAIERRFRTTPRPLGVQRREGVVVSAAETCFDKMCLAFIFTDWKETAMKRLAMLSAGLILGSPALALAAEHSAGYRGIGQLYFSLMAAILIYGVYDTFGKTATYVMAPIIIGTLYWMLPPN